MTFEEWWKDTGENMIAHSGIKLSETELNIVKNIAFTAWNVSEGEATMDDSECLRDRWRYMEYEFPEEIRLVCKDNDRFKQFCCDMWDKELDVRYYEGRNFYKGPSVTCNNIQDVLRLTKVPCLWDNLGTNWIVYPK